MSRYEELETFTRIVDAGSLTAAADQMRLAKSAVSRRLKDLESRLGVQLMQRSGRRLVLTEPGEALYQRSVALLSDWAETEAVASQAGVELAGTLRLSAPLSFGVTHLSPAILAFMEAHPAIQIDVDFTDRFVDLVPEGYDLAIRIGNLPDSALMARKLASICSVVVASPSLIDPIKHPMRPEDLKPFQECVYGRRKSAAWHYKAPDGTRGQIDLKPRIIATNGEFLREAAMAGEGILKIPRFIVYKELQSGALIELLPDYEWDTLSLYAVYPPTRHLSSRVRAFIDFLATRFKGTPYWEA